VYFDAIGDASRGTDELEVSVGVINPINPRADGNPAVQLLLRVLRDWYRFRLRQLSDGGTRKVQVASQFGLREGDRGGARKGSRRERETRERENVFGGEEVRVRRSRHDRGVTGVEALSRSLFRFSDLRP
jgi:hypothetical protein